MSDIKLEAVTAADRDQWAALWRDYLTFYETERDDATYHAAFAQLMSSDPLTFRGQLAWRGGTALGLVHWLWHPHMWRPEGTVYLQDLYVAPDARGIGLGRRLIEAVYADAAARDVKVVYWMTNANNPARALYDQVADRTDFIKYQRVAE